MSKRNWLVTLVMGSSLPVGLVVPVTLCTFNVFFFTLEITTRRRIAEVLKERNTTTHVLFSEWCTCSVYAECMYMWNVQFTDILIYASAVPPANTTYRVIKRIPLHGMKVVLRFSSS